LGALTSSIAQAVDEPIAAIIAQGQTALQLLRRPQQDMAAVTAAIAVVIEEGRRAAEIVSRVRRFLRKDAPQHADFDLRGAIEAAALLVQRDLLSHQVSLRLDLEEGLPLLAGDRARIEHVIVHLMINGIQAMAHIRDRPRALLVRTRRSRDRAIVHVQDNGHGFADRDTDRLFEPAFTTRDDGMRRDIGLAVCRASVEAHGGRIWTTEAPGPGAIVQFSLPLPLAPARVDAPLLTAAEPCH
jgi:two-component system sensor kinase FixL